MKTWLPSNIVKVLNAEQMRWVMGILLLGIMIFVIFIVQRKNYLADNIHQYYVDEVHTVRWALMPKIPTYRVGESNRWLGRALTPMALVYMNKNLGSYHKEFNFPGLHYYNKNFDQNEMGKNGIEDPGLQDFYYALRIQYVVVFALVLFLFFLFYCYREKDFFVPIIMIIYLGGSKYLLHEQGIFYAEPLLFMMFVLGCFFLYAGTESGHISDYAKKIPLLAFWYVFSMSVKISTVFLIFIPLVIIFYEKYPLHKKIQNCLAFFGYAGLIFIFIHITAFIGGGEKIGLLIQGFTVNFWSYNSFIVDDWEYATGWSYINKIFDLIRNDFGILFYLFIPSVMVSFWLSNSRRKVIKSTLLIILLLSLLSLSQQMMFLKRNIVPFYFLFLFLSLSSLLEICQRCKERWLPKYAKFVIPFVVVILAADRLYALSNSDWKFYHTFDRTKKDAVAFFKKVKSIDKKNHSYSVGMKFDMENHTSLDNFSIPSSFKMFPHHQESWKKIASSREPFAIIIHRVERNYFLTNSIFPSHGLKLKRFGNYFVFYRGL